MLPESLTENQKRFLRRQYRLDVDNPVRSRRLHRFQIMFLWVMPLLAAGLVWIDRPDLASLAERPAEILTWAVAVFFLAGEAFIFAVTWRRMRKTPPTPPTYYWFAMFRSAIGLPTPALVLWTHRIGTIAIILAALLTRRPELAVAWVAATAMGLARRSWEYNTVKNALVAIDRNLPEQGA